MWWIRPANNNAEAEYVQDKNDDSYNYDTAKTCQLAQPITCGSTIRLTHSLTNRNLHSHLVDSVLSHQQEVSCFGSGDAKGDAGDNWIVECNANNKGSTNNYWKRNTSFRLKHIDTGKYLGTARKLEFNHENCGHNCPIMNHLEAFGRSGTDQHTLLFIDQGVHLSK
jgi:dolichyl-phosphate-mannose--protein O-mannosyl transferase